MDSRHTLRLVGSAADIELAMGSLRRFAVDHGMPPRQINQLLVVADELLSNIFRHALQGEGGDDVIVRMAMEGDHTIRLDFIDRGPPFDPLKRSDPDTDQPLEERPIGGLGILLVKRLSDRVEYHYEKGENHLSLWKRFHEMD